MDLQTGQSAELVSDPQACRAIEALNANRTSNRISGRAGLQQELNQLLESEWTRLPYAMMQLTAAGVSRPGAHFYWRDHSVHLGEMKLHLTRIPRGNDDAAAYTATYSIEEVSRVFHLRPMLEGNALRWSIPGICEENLTTAQLGRKLLDKFVTFYSTGLRELATSVRTDSALLPRPRYDVTARSRAAK